MLTQLSHPVVGCGGLELDQEDFPPFLSSAMREGIHYTMLKTYCLI